MRDKILKILIDNGNDFISGERISTSLGITRAAVWKHIKTLQEEGFDIESKSRLGYKLIGIPDALDRVTLIESIKTKVMGRNIEVYDEIGSTNNRARELAIEDVTEGTLIIAESQLEGRGRLGRSWVSPKGKNICMSFILRPDIPPKEASRMTTIIAVGIRRALKKATGLNIGIKWPNDIIIGGKKICGILTEMHGDIDRIHYIIVGIGINVNMTKDDFPPDIELTATSLRIAMNQTIDRRKIIALIMEEIEEVYFQYIRDHNFNQILDECRKHSVTLNKRVRVIGRDSNFNGLAVDFDGDGSLLVKRDDGSITRVMSGDVSVRGEKGYI